MSNRLGVWMVTAFAVAIMSFPVPSASETFKLRILHTNDMHSRFQQVSGSTGKCSEYDAAHNLCYGGFGRVRTALNDELAKAKAENVSVLALNAGDNYQGTLWYTIFKWKAVLHFFNMLKFDAMSLGNHEFDDGIEGLLPFLNQTNVPIVTCNIDPIEEPKFGKAPVKDSIILERGGQKIGIIGYVTRQTATMAHPGKLKFESEVDCIKREAEKLKKQNVEIIIALGHSGLDEDIIIAKSVPYLDVIVGGHSHTFLYTGTPPDSEKPTNTYPVMVTQESGRKVPIVQAYAFTKYLGKIDVEFDEKGEVVEAKGNPILLNYEIKEDPEVVESLKEWQLQLNDSLQHPIGKTRVVLEGRRCRFEECNLGSVMADSFIYHAVQNHTGSYWTNVAIALQQGGGVRASINVTGSNGTVIREDAMTVMPFFGSLSVVQVNGKTLLSALEWSVTRYDTEFHVGRGEFLQVSGLRVTYDLSKRPGSRVVSVRVRCASCEVPEYRPLDMKAEYNVIMPTFLLEGGDNFTMFKQNAKEILRYDTLDTDIFIKYINESSVIYTGLEDRIQFHKSRASVIKISFIHFTIILCLFIAK
ncbi:hypothetical protein RUM44_012478 [Polyplax serrata]|uniref:5'-nucleotidase n=1 Tax=Polyplax serrata TaxID=468196 RepID=A0ABR1BBF8_POLSC